jgi:hypothetical protein
VPPQRLFTAEPVLQAPDGDPMIFKVHVVDGEHQGFTHAQAVVVDDAKQRPVTGGFDGLKQPLELVLGEIFG